MTDLVIEETGEVVSEMTAVEAERITSQIAHHLDRIADSMELVMPLIGEALTRGAWRVLGYASPTAYTSERFSGALTRLALPVRRELVAELSAAGMSTRAIAPIIGKDFSTVSRDAAAGVAECNTSPAPAPVADPPRGEWTSATEALANLTDDQAEDEPANEPEPETTRHGLPVTDTVIGLDGRNYPKPTSAPKPKRKPLPDQALHTAEDMTRAAERLADIFRDDRLAQNKEQVAALTRSHLNRTIEVCRDLIDLLDA